MKYSILVSFALLIIVGFVGIGGFSYFNKRLTESKNQKETGGVVSEISKTVTSSDTSANMSAVETTLKFQNISPSDRSTVTSPYITIRGKTVAGADVFVNDTETTSDAQGNFSVGLTLDEGENPIMIVANDANGNVGETEITIIYDTNE